MIYNNLHKKISLICDRHEAFLRFHKRIIKERRVKNEK